MSQHYAVCITSPASLMLWCFYTRSKAHNMLYIHGWHTAAGSRNKTDVGVNRGRKVHTSQGVTLLVDNMQEPQI